MTHSNAILKFFGIIFTIVWFLCSIYIFTNGFLLSRREIELKSSCQNKALNKSLNSTNTCWTVPNLNNTYKNVVIIVIDALRYDFAFFQQNKPSNQLPYLNKLSIFKELADEYGCSSVRLFKFRADAPTTTMQRLKGMTTGSFPTFIDVRNNFDSSEISEDNFIDQLVKVENITFLGDDTWEKLFPGRFSVSFSFPSFDVKDLHLVDNGILQHLLPELNKRNWKLLIAHFLGVDHCGHRYGPLHFEMAAKLEQMNSMLRTVVDSLESDDLLLVMGDHGMTQTGDHGGETAEEIDSALFAFSKSGKFSKTEALKSENCAAGLVHQIDIVPTLSLLFSTPIPFSNLGSLIVDFIPNTSPSLLSEALFINAKQVVTYLKEYGSRYGKFTSPEFQQSLHSLEQLDQSSEDPNRVLHLLHSLRQQCKSVWADFDENSMALGSCLFCTMCIMLYRQHLSVYLLPIFSAIFFLCFFLVPASNQVLVILFSLSALLIQVLQSFKEHQMTLIGLICTFLPLLYTSNSFVINEDVIVLFLYSSAVTLLLLVTVQQTYSDSAQKQASKTKKANRSFFAFRQFYQFFLQNPLGKFLLLFLGFLLSVRAAFMFRICRPEQFWCFQTEDVSDDSDAVSISSKGGIHYVDAILDFSDPWRRFFVSGSSLLAVLLTLNYRLKQEGNLRRPYSAAVVCNNNLLWAAIVCIILNWQLQAATYEKILDELPDFFVVLLPRCAYFLLLLSFVWWIWSPLTVHILYQDKYGRYCDEIALSNDEVVSFYFNQLKHQFSGNSLDRESKSNLGAGTPVAFGMYTLLSAALIGLGTVFILFGAMLLEEKYAPVFLLFVFSTWTLLEILSAVRHRCSDDPHHVSLDVIGIWVLSSSFWWFATGHQCSLSSIPWNAAFVGFTGSHPTVVLPALMVGANIFISPILHTVFLPLLLLWPLTRGLWFSRKSSSLNKSTVINSEYQFLQSPLFWTSLSDLFLKYILFHALKVLGCICAAFIHRRHLMVWQIFAPRFVYEVLEFSVVCVMTILVYLLIIMFKRSLHSWTKKQNFNFSQQ